MPDANCHLCWLGAAAPAGHGSLLVGDDWEVRGSCSKFPVLAVGWCPAYIWAFNTRFWACCCPSDQCSSCLYYFLVVFVWKAWSSFLLCVLFFFCFVCFFLFLFWLWCTLVFYFTDRWVCESRCGYMTSSAMSAEAALGYLFLPLVQSATHAVDLFSLVAFSTHWWMSVLAPLVVCTCQSGSKQLDLEARAGELGAVLS